MKASTPQRTAAAVGLRGVTRLVVVVSLVVGAALGLGLVLWLGPGLAGVVPHGALAPFPGSSLPPRAPDHAGLDAPVEIHPGGLPPGIASKLIFPLEGWLLEIVLAPGAPVVDPESLELELELELELDSGHRVASWPATAFRRTVRGLATNIDAAPLTLEPGSLRIRARRAGGASGTGAGKGTGDGGSPVTWTEVRIDLQARTVEAPIGRDQVLHFDFEIDRNGDGTPDFLRDLESFGLASSDHPMLGREVAQRVARAALARARRAYAGPLDPIDLEPIDPVAIELRLEDGTGGEFTRICVGGGDPSGGHTVGNLPFDPGNGDRRSIECGELPATGLFPRALLAYRTDALFRATFDPLRPARGGWPVGRHPADASILTGAMGARVSDAERRARAEVIVHAIDVFAHALGSIMAHEAAHALGLVAPGDPSEGGLYGGREGPDAYHRIPSDADGPSSTADGEETLGLMSSGPALSFAQLAGRGETGELVFDPLSLAYLRDDILLPCLSPTSGPR